MDLAEQMWVTAFHLLEVPPPWFGVLRGGVVGDWGVNLRHVSNSLVGRRRYSCCGVLGLVCWDLLGTFVGFVALGLLFEERD